MNTIKFNNVTFEVESYNKNTAFNGEIISEDGYAGLRTSNVSQLRALAETTITSIQIYHDENLIYNL